MPLNPTTAPKVILTNNRRKLTGKITSRVGKRETVKLTLLRVEKAHNTI